MDQSEDRVPKFRRRPDEVLDAASLLFSRHGFAHTTVEQVARAAGLSKAAVYLYFPSKQSLLAGLVRRAVTPLAELALEQIAAYRGAPRPLIGTVLRLLAGRLSDSAVFAVPSLILRKAAVAPEMARVYRDEVLDRVLPALRGLLAQGGAT